MGSAHKTATTRMLLDHVERGRTGRLSVGAGSAEVALFLLDGSVVGTRAGDDTSTLIARLGSSGHLSSSRVRQLQAMVSMSLPILGRQTHDPILGLLSDEVGSRFERVLEHRFRENVRRFVGHHGTPRYQDELSPWCENIRTVHDTVALISRSVQDFDLSTSLPDDLNLSSGPVPPSSDDEVALLAVLGDGSKAVRQLLDTFEDEPIGARANLVRMVEKGVLAKGNQPVTADDFLPAETTDASGLLSADELDAFAGEEDKIRGGSQGGTFITQSHNLDRVDIGNLDFSSSDDAGSAKEPAYAAPSLTESDALDKIDVANHVLGVVSRAIDDTKGSQRGSGTIQLLVDGRPRHYTALFDGIRVTSGGGLPSRDLLTNLRRRPATEQRRLLNQGLLDLLDRVLDKAADDLPEDAFDSVLPRVMGYRQRMGL